MPRSSFMFGVSSPRSVSAGLWLLGLLVFVSGVGASIEVSPLVSAADEPRSRSVEDGGESASEGSASTWTYQFLDTAGQPLPFDEAGLLDFLSTARVVSEEAIPRGITKPKKLTLERDGISAHAVFRSVNELRREGPPALPRSALYFKDHYAYEVAAYHLSRRLGIDRVPPVVVRKVDGTRGSVQLWMEDVIMNSDRRKLGLVPPNLERWAQQEQTKFLFDAIVGNIDRNRGNLLIDRSWTSWFIDHTRCFIVVKEPPRPDLVTSCDRRLWRRMQDIDPEELKKTMKPYLDGGERKNLAARFEYMVHHIRRLIEARGEDAVLFDLLPAGPPVESWADEGRATKPPGGSDR